MTGYDDPNRCQCACDCGCELDNLNMTEESKPYCLPCLEGIHEVPPEPIRTKCQYYTSAIYPPGKVLVFLIDSTRKEGGVWVPRES